MNRFFVAVSRAHAAAEHDDAIRAARPCPPLDVRTIETPSGTLYMVSIAGMGAPKDLLARTTEEAARADGALYVARNWGQRTDGTWTPYPREWK